MVDSWKWLGDFDSWKKSFVEDYSRQLCIETAIF